MKEFWRSARAADRPTHRLDAGNVWIEGTRIQARVARTLTRSIAWTEALEAIATYLGLDTHWFDDKVREATAASRDPYPPLRTARRA